MVTVKKKFVTQVKYIFFVLYIFFTRFTEGHGKHSINRTSGFNGEAVLSLAVRCNKVASSCKVYTCWKLHENFVSLFVRNAFNFFTGCTLPGALRVNAASLARLCLIQIPPLIAYSNPPSHLTPSPSQIYTNRLDIQLAVVHVLIISFTSVSMLLLSEQILSPRRFCPPGHNPLAEIVPHGHNPLADIVPFPQILFPPPPSNRCLAVPVFLIGVRSYKPRPLFASSQKGKLSTHTLPLPLQSRSAINLPSCQTSWLRL